MIKKSPEEFLQHWEECGDALFSQVRQPCAVFGLDPTKLAPELRSIAAVYLAILPGEKKVTRGEVLKHLQDLLKYKPKSVVSHLKTLPIDAVRAMYRHFPVPMIEFSDIDDASNVFPILYHDRTLVPAWKSRTARRFGSGGVGAFRASGWSAQTPPINDKTLAVARRHLLRSFQQDPDGFRRHLNFIVDLLLDGFQVRGVRGGRNTALDAGVVAGPDWQLADRVVEAVWPEGSGPMAWNEIVAVRTDCRSHQSLRL